MTDALAAAREHPCPRCKAEAGQRCSTPGGVVAARPHAARLALVPDAPAGPPEPVTGDTVRRDQWKRPLIIPEGGAKPVPYTRVSTLAKSLDDGGNLAKWSTRISVAGLLARPDLRNRLAALQARVGLAGLVSGDGRRDMDSLMREAAEAGGSRLPASAGTGLHELTEALDLGHATLDDLQVGADTRRRLAAYVAATEDLEPVAVEQFVVCDRLTAAGTLDRLYRVRGPLAEALGVADGAVVVGDVKSGAWDAKYPLGVSVQVATYAHGKRYWSDGTQEPLHPDLDTGVGLLVHLPAKGDPSCAVYPLDLERGWQAALVAADVLAIRKWKAPDLISSPVRRNS